MKNDSMIDLTWSPMNIAGWNISYYYLVYLASDLSESSRPLSKKFVLDGDLRTKSLYPDSLFLQPDKVHIFELSAILAVEGLEGLGEVRGSVATANMTLSYSKSYCTYLKNEYIHSFVFIILETVPFQVMLGPVDHCVVWGVSILCLCFLIITFLSLSYSNKLCQNHLHFL